MYECMCMNILYTPHMHICILPPNAVYFLQNVTHFLTEQKDRRTGHPRVNFSPLFPRPLMDSSGVVAGFAVRFAPFPSPFTPATGSSDARMWPRCTTERYRRRDPRSLLLRRTKNRYETTQGEVRRRFQGVSGHLGASETL